MHCRTTTTFIQETSELTPIDNGNDNKDTYILVVIVVIVFITCMLNICYKRGKIVSD